MSKSPRRDRGIETREPDLHEARVRPRPAAISPAMSTSKPTTREGSPGSASMNGAPLPRRRRTASRRRLRWQARDNAAARPRATTDASQARIAGIIRNSPSLTAALSGAAARAPPACAASRRAAAATATDRPAGGHRSGTRAVVGFVRRVHDALHRRAAHGAGLAVAAVHRHALAKRRDLLGKPVAGLVAQPRDPVDQRRARRPRTAAAISSSLSRCVSLNGDRRAACRISSEYALPMPLNRCGSVSARLSVWFSRGARRERSSVAPPALRARRDRARRAPRALDDVKRRLSLRPASVRRACPWSKSNASRPDLAGNLRTGRLPPEPAGNHQVKHQEQFAFEFHDDPLSEPTKPDDRRPSTADRRRIDRSQQERAAVGPGRRAARQCACVSAWR